MSTRAQELIDSVGNRRYVLVIALVLAAVGVAAIVVVLTGRFS